MEMSPLLPPAKVSVAAVTFPAAEAVPAVLLITSALYV
jgi:hypothetical protein